MQQDSDLCAAAGYPGIRSNTDLHARQGKTSLLRDHTGHVFLQVSQTDGHRDVMHLILSGRALL